MQSDVWDEESKITLFDSALNQQTELDFDYAITAIKSSSEGELLIGVKDGVMSSPYFDGFEHTLRTISPFNGTTTCKSAPLL